MSKHEQPMDLARSVTRRRERCFISIHTGHLTSPSLDHELRTATCWSIERKVTARDGKTCKTQDSLVSPLTSPGPPARRPESTLGPWPEHPLAFPSLNDKTDPIASSDAAEKLQENPPSDQQTQRASPVQRAKQFLSLTLPDTWTHFTVLRHLKVKSKGDEQVTTKAADRTPPSPASKTEKMDTFSNTESYTQLHACQIRAQHQDIPHAHVSKSSSP